MDDNKINNPRRLDADDETVEYLVTLNKQLTERGIYEPDVEGVENLVNNVLDEIKTRAASLASDRRTSLIIENLVLRSNLEQVLEFSQRLSPYSTFLAQNRYSSHVLQVFFFKNYSDYKFLTLFGIFCVISLLYLDCVIF